MKSYFFISTLAILFGVTPVHGQVNLLGMEQASADSLVKCRISYFSFGVGERAMKRWFIIDNRNYDIKKHIIYEVF